MLKMNHVNKNYSKFHLDCTLQVKPGYITGLIGQNGSGKTTSFKASLGLIPIDSGSISILGKNIDDFSAKDREQLGVVLSDSGFSNYLSIYDLIPILSNLYSRFDKDFFLTECSHFSLPLKKKIKDFSTGMKAKLKVIIALSHHASLLILDEPTAGLDVIARDEILNLLRVFMEENEENGILISSHISSDLEGLCDDLYMIHEGNIIFHEDTDKLLSEYAVLKVSKEKLHQIDQQYILKIQKEAFGYCCLTNEKQYYLDNYPDIIIENGTIDELMMIMIRGEEL
ncbi:ABC transporter ATP-binding protein [Anaerostipes sp. 494a]|uniref:ABC transporter ATP-binding protein n=1 Tax=Anaerostipes TaxID=207244 RepID=UPI0009532A79|nr:MULTISPECIES: ABC transporter ATP-binding protein [Anaerostipes]MCI5622134.1 ABC transporter ATP-binding protein [Anaerostipes sp.]OLR58193.1 ABC transporter ATP-binding protein [Anaerostipes sp. 494a]